MKKQTIKKHLQDLLKNPIRIRIPLSQLTSYKVGGPADFLVSPQDLEELSVVLKFIHKHKLKYYVMGNGTNIIAVDKGFNGIIISLKEFNKMMVHEEKVTCEAGADLDSFVLYTIKQGLSGLENLSWIPGTLGGALRMNAGAHGSEIADYATDILIMDWKGNSSRISKNQAGFSYRTAKNLADKIILRATFSLYPSSKKELMNHRKKIINLRKQKQPWQYPSAGSVFKRPPGFYAGTLISQAGLGGYRIGGAEVSEKHSGFIINRGKATAKDIISLIKHIKDCVYKKFNIKLQLEQIILE